jgi:hypothetical protein
MNQIDPLLIAISLAWLACIIICVLKGKYGMAIIGVAAAVAQYIGLPPISGYYILNVIYPLAFVPFWGALRLAHPESYYAFWFYRNNPQKYMRAVTRYGMETEYAAMIVGDVEVSSEFELFLRRKLTPEQRLSGLKTTEAAEFAKLTRLGTDAYIAEKQAALAPKIDAIVAEARERRTNQNTKSALDGIAATSNKPNGNI